MATKVCEIPPNVSPKSSNANIASKYKNVSKCLVDEDGIMMAALKKRKARDRHNQRQHDKRKGIYNLTSWHVSRLRTMEERLDNDYATFTQYIKWKNGIAPEEDNYDDENEFLDDLKNEFDRLGGYAFFKKHNLSFPPNGVSIDNTFFD